MRSFELKGFGEDLPVPAAERIARWMDVVFIRPNGGRQTDSTSAFYDNAKPPRSNCDNFVTRFRRSRAATGCQRGTGCGRADPATWMSTLRVLTVDDEALARRRLTLQLRNIPMVDHVGEAASSREALDRIDALHPDAVLLDIQMPQGSGFDVVDALSRRERAPIVIVVTGSARHALTAFERNVAGYLMKPVEKDQLVRTLQRARELSRLLDAEDGAQELEQIVENLRGARRVAGKTAYSTTFRVRSDTEFTTISIDDIECVGSEDDFVSLHTNAGSFLMRASIRQFMDAVEPGLFLRVHRRWLVRKAAIRELRDRASGASEVVLLSGRRVPAGPVFLKRARKALGPVRST